MSEKQRHMYGESSQTAYLLKFLCEGHNLPMQNRLREQPGKSVSTNLVSLKISTVMALCQNANQLKRMEDQEVTDLNTKV